MENIDEFDFVSARKIRGHIVYGLKDANGIFYVGRTHDPARRFDQYVKKAREHNQWHLVRRMKEAGDSLRVVVLATNPPDLAKAEADAILAYCQQLANVNENPYRPRSGIAVSLKCDRTPKAACPICDQPITNRLSRYCQDCIGKLVKRGESKTELREMLAGLR